MRSQTRFSLVQKILLKNSPWRYTIPSRSNNPNIKTHSDKMKIWEVFHLSIMITVLATNYTILKFPILNITWDETRRITTIVGSHVKMILITSCKFELRGMETDETTTCDFFAMHFCTRFTKYTPFSLIGHWTHRMYKKRKRKIHFFIVSTWYSTKFVAFPWLWFETSWRNAFPPQSNKSIIYPGPG